MADPSSTRLGRMLSEEITPVVMVLRTPLVEEACIKNGLSFVDILSPFSLFTNIDVPVRTASDQPYRLQKFKLRLFYASEIRKLNLEAAKERLKKVVTEAEDLDESDISELPKFENMLASSKLELLPSWFDVFNEELVRASSFSDHEAFDHPVACLLVVSSKDKEPISKFVDLFNTNQLPSILNDGVMDPKILKHYVLLHDNQDGPVESASTILSEMKSTFGPSDCHLLCVNSSQDGPIENEVNPWASYKKDASFTQRPGGFLSSADIDEIKLFMQDLCSTHIIPYMEQKIRELNQQVSVTRKGFRNQIKNLWWRKGKEDTPDTPDGPAYTFSSIESQIRVLGDYAFMLQDYELALSNYRLISTDYKLDKAWKRYAGVQEMMGLTYFMLDQSRKEAEYCMENAFGTYLKIGPHCQQNAVRCGLWWVETLKARDQYKEAATVYFRVSGEEPLLSAVMLEQASYCYLFSVPSMLRKYGFHLVLAGDSYRKCEQMKHAIRTYRSALSVLKGTAWGLIRDRIHFQLGKWYAILGKFDVAIGHTLEILACTHQSKAAQELFLGDFLQLVQKTGKTFEVCRLQLPVVKLPSLRVVFEDHRTYASPAAVLIKESLWRSMEEDMIPSFSTAKANWLELQTKLVSRKYNDSNVCIAGEAIKVDIGFKNPLQIPISVSNVSLICKNCAMTEETDKDNASWIQSDEELRKLIATGELNTEDSSFTLSEVDFSLSGGETLVVQLTVNPKAEGMLKIVGVRWKLSGSVVGFQIFESHQAKRKPAKSRRKAKHSHGSELKFLVIKALPRLEGSIRKMPKKCFLGELHSLVLELKNSTDFPIKNLKMKISHPRFLIVGDCEGLNLEFPALLLDKDSGRFSAADGGDEVHSLFQFPEGCIIKRQPVFWPLWFRAAVPGPISLYITIYYEMEDTSSIMRYRTLRMCYSLEVLPSLDVSFHISRCPSRLKEFLVRMYVVNKTSTESFEIHQLSCVGNKSEITMLQPVDIPVPVMAGQTLTCFFKLKDGGKAVISEDSIISHDGTQGSHIALHTQLGSQPLFDIFRSPVTDFHHHERLLQISDQRHSYTMDLILISQSHGSSSGSASSDHSRILSYHACHCSVASICPIYWLMDGPKIIHHDFASSFCEINLSMTMYNSLDAGVSVHVDTDDSSPNASQPSDSTGAASETETGWHDVSLGNDLKVTSDVLATRAEKCPLLESVSPFVWSGTCSTRVELAQLSTAEVPLQICVFSPGIYDLSNYQLQWSVQDSNAQNLEAGMRQSSGSCSGRPFYLTVLQST